MNLSTDKEFITFLTSILTKANLIELNETPALTPYHFITISGESSSHYKMRCGNKRFFLKSVKDNDNTLFCLPYLSNLNGKNGAYKFPEALTSSFTYKGRDFYILRYLEGETLEELDDVLTFEEWKFVSQELKERLNELYYCVSQRYSAHDNFYDENFGDILIDKMISRLNNPLFQKFSQADINTAVSKCKQILSNTVFPQAHLIHMDIKPGNIIFNRKERLLSLIDFENARFCDNDYGKVQMLLDGYKDYPRSFLNFVLPHILDGFTIDAAIGDDKCLCYLFYQTLCNLIFYDSRKLTCPTPMSDLFVNLLKIFKKR